MFLDQLPEPIDDPDKHFDDLIEKMAASTPVDRFRSRNIRAMNETADRILVGFTRDLAKARRDGDHQGEQKCCRQIQEVHEGRKRWEEFYHSPEYASRVTTQWLDFIRENKGKWREENRQRWEANAAENQKLRAQIESRLSIVRKMREGNQEAESSFNDDVPELGEPFKTVLEKMLQGPAEAACFLAEDPMNVRVACVMWLAEVEYRVRYNRSGLPSQGFYHCTRALQTFGDRRHIPVPRLWEYYCVSTANPLDPPSDHRLCSSHPSLKPVRALALGDIYRLAFMEHSFADQAFQAIVAETQELRGQVNILEKSLTSLVTSECRDSAPQQDGAGDGQSESGEAGNDGWPPNDGWGFAAGKFSFHGTVFPLSGIDWSLLKKLVESRTPVERRDLEDAGWPENDGVKIEDKVLGTHLSNLRTKLRKFLSLPKEYNPIPTVDRGLLAAWEINPDLRRPRPR